jgi:zinc protease
VRLKNGFTLCALLALFVATASSAPAAESKAAAVFPFKVSETTLDNGLRVVTIPYESPGIVAYFSVVRTGSRDEVEAGRTGFAHFFEHMMFRGTDKYSQDGYNDALKRIGADFNAFTSNDYTNYYMVAPASELDKIMDVESDRFKNLKYSQELFRTEALAVLGEYNKNASNPLSPMIDQVSDLAFSKHTYKHSTIGFLADVKAMPEGYDYSRRFFDSFYRPENVILVVVGDVQPEQVNALARKYYGDWKKGYKAPEIPVEPPLAGPKEARIDWPAPTRPYLMMGYRAPAFSTRTVDSATLALISQLLFSESAPLYQELVVDKQWTDQVAGGNEDSRDPYLFLIYARIKSDDLIEPVHQKIDEHIARLQKDLVDAKRLDRIKSHLIYSFASRLDNPEGVGFQVGSALALTGQVETINQSFEQYQKVTPEDVRRVAQQIFRPANQVVVTLSHPAPKTDQAPAPTGATSSESGR